MDNEYIINLGLLSEQELNSQLSETSEYLHNLLQEFKKFRYYVNPGTLSWERYILTLFQHLGFAVRIDSQGLLILSDINNIALPKAIVGLAKPGVNFHEIAPGLNWASHLFFAANCYKVDWGIITDGSQMNILNFKKEDYHLYNFMINIDGIIENQNEDSFQKFFQVFSIINGNKGTPLIIKPENINGVEVNSPVEEYQLFYHTNGKSPDIVSLYLDLHKNILSLANSVTIKYHKMYISYLINEKNFCEIDIQKKCIKVWVDIHCNDIHDPFSICKDVSKIGFYDLGDTEILLIGKDGLVPTFDVIKQSFIRNYHLNDDLRQLNKYTAGQPNENREFWTKLLAKAKEFTDLHKWVSPSDVSWISTSAGRKGLSYMYIIRANDAQVLLYIDNGNKSWNKNTYNLLIKNKTVIERTFGEKLLWRLMDQKRGSVIGYVIPGYGLNDKDHWSEIRIQLIEVMIRFHKAIQPFIDGLVYLNI
jgi:predicted transport protein